MDSSNASDFVVEDNLDLDDGSSFTGLSSIGMDMGQIIEKMQKMETQLSEMEELREENDKMKEEIGKLGGENGKLKEQMTEMKDEMNKMMNEIGQLKDQITGGTNAQQIPLKFDSNELNKNKMDLADCASKLRFAKNELLVDSCGCGYGSGWKFARAILPVPKFDPNATETYIAFYFEGHIQQKPNLDYPWKSAVAIGFCSYQFPLELEFAPHIGNQENLIGIYRRDGMHNCGKWESFQEAKDPFKAGEKIGLGLIYEPKNAAVKCFAICNRKLLGLVELPANFFNVKIFPVVGFCGYGNSIYLNFGNEDWDFDPRQILELIQ